jgi:hypothetical protein
MRILTLGGKMLTKGLRDHGHEVMALGPIGTLNHPLDRETDFFQSAGSARGTVRELASAFRPDWIIQVDDSLPLPHLGLEDIPIPKAWWAVDTHLHGAWHRPYAPLFDRVFSAQLNQVETLAAFRSGVEWLPLSFPYEPEFLPWGSREHDVSFVGTVDAALNPARVELLGKLASLGRPVNVVQGICGPVYRASRAVLNQSVRDDLNSRVFEAMGFGAVLITDRLTHSLREIGEPGRDFLVYEPGDAADLDAKIRWVLGNPAEAEAMARRGHARVVGAHAIGHRIRQVTESLASWPAPSPSAVPGAIPSQPAPSDPGKAHARVLAHLSAAHEHLSRLALPSAVTGFFAAEAGRIASRALEASPREPFAQLTLAQLDLEKGAHADALARIETVADWEGEGEEYRRRYVFLRALLLAHGGRMVEARQAVLSGLRGFPGDSDLARLAQVLGP